MFRVSALLGAAAALAPAATGAGAQELAAGASASVAEPARGPLRIERGEDPLPILVPRDEKLVYAVRVDLGWLGETKVGCVTITSKVEPYQGDLLLASPAVLKADTRSDAPQETGFIEAHAKGAYALYELDDRITCTLLPQRWPSLIYRQVQTGSEHRKREMMLGWSEGAFASSFRADGHCQGCEQRGHFLLPTWSWHEEHHCRKCKRGEHRVWGQPKLRKVPQGSVDMLSAVFLARSMLQLGGSRMEFPLVDRSDLWTVRLSTGKTRRTRVPAGTFDTVRVALVAERAEQGGREGKFAGLFGLHGTVSIWLHPTGVPVEIRGNVPFGPVDLGVSIELEHYHGTPAGFEPARRRG